MSHDMTPDNRGINASDTNRIRQVDDTAKRRNEQQSSRSRQRGKTMRERESKGDGEKGKRG